jgi:hypothetical protein
MSPVTRCTLLADAELITPASHGVNVDDVWESLEPAADQARKITLGEGSVCGGFGC